MKKIIIFMIFIPIGYCILPLILPTELFIYKEYIQAEEISKIKNLNISLGFRPTVTISSSLPLIAHKHTYGRPYKLYLNVKGGNIPYDNLRINHIFINQSSGEKIIVKDNSSSPIILPFVKYQSKVAYCDDFDKLIDIEHQAGQELTVNISLTLMPSEEAINFKQKFNAVTFKERAYIYEVLKGI